MYKKGTKVRILAPAAGLEHCREHKKAVGMIGTIVDVEDDCYDIELPEPVDGCKSWYYEHDDVEPVDVGDKVPTTCGQLVDLAEFEKKIRRSERARIAKKLFELSKGD